MCGDVFISKRDPGEVLANDMDGPDYRLLKLFQPGVDRDRRLVAASAFGHRPGISVFCNGLGCTHVVGNSKGELREETANVFDPTPATGSDVLWLNGDRVDVGRFRKGWIGRH